MTDQDPQTDPRWRLTPDQDRRCRHLADRHRGAAPGPTYDQKEPRLFGFPFFYWYQLVWVFICAGLCGLSFCCSSGSGTPPVSQPSVRWSSERINWVALIVLILLFAVVTVMGFMAAALAAPGGPDLHEWGLGGKSFGTVTTWFLLGGDLYTAYTFIAVPAAMSAPARCPASSRCRTRSCSIRSSSSSSGRMWSVAHRHGYVTTADIVQGRYGTRSLSLAVALTGILATMPYIALQLVGIQAVLERSASAGPACSPGTCRC